MGIADVYLAEVGAPGDEWEREIATEVVKSLRDVPALVGDEELLRYAARPVVGFMIKFAADLWPGTDCAEDAERAASVALARREIAIQGQAGIHTELGDLTLLLPVSARQRHRQPPVRAAGRPDRAAGRQL